jgi:hypothetical protein
MTNERDNRVLGRIGARELSEQETQNVNGGFRLPTGAPCTGPSPSHPNGDGVPADCGGV